MSRMTKGCNDWAIDEAIALFENNPDKYVYMRKYDGHRLMYQHATPPIVTTKLNAIANKELEKKILQDIDILGLRYYYLDMEACYKEVKINGFDDYTDDRTQVPSMLKANGLNDNKCNFYIFDIRGHQCKLTFEQRYDTLKRAFIEHSDKLSGHLHLCKVYHENLRKHYNEYPDIEGFIVRRLDSLDYSSNNRGARATKSYKDFIKIKYKNMQVATILSFMRLKENNGEFMYKDALGKSVKNAKNENKVEMNLMGSLGCETSDFISFDIGAGFTDEQRKDIFNNFDNYRNKRIRFECSSFNSETNKFTNPVFKGFVDDRITLQL